MENGISGRIDNPASSKYDNLLSITNDVNEFASIEKILMRPFISRPRR